MNLSPDGCRERRTGPVGGFGSHKENTVMDSPFTRIGLRRPLRRRGLRAAALAVAALVATGIAAPADSRSEADLIRASNFFNRIDTLRAPFHQYNADGTVSSGTFYMRRPGRLRMEFDDQDTLVIASAGQVAIFDGGSNTARPQKFPLSRTPLSAILSRTVDLRKSDMITGQHATKDRIYVTALDPDNPDRGSAEFAFSRDPVVLETWVMHNATGETVRVEFGEMETDVDLSGFLFNIRHETASRR